MVWVVWCDGEEWEASKRVLASHKAFETREEAQAYANTVAVSRHPEIAETFRGPVSISIKQQDTKEFQVILTVDGLLSLEESMEVKTNLIRFFELMKRGKDIGKW